MAVKVTASRKRARFSWRRMPGRSPGCILDDSPAAVDRAAIGAGWVPWNGTGGRSRRFLQGRQRRFRDPFLLQQESDATHCPLVAVLHCHAGNVGRGGPSRGQVPANPLLRPRERHIVCNMSLRAFGEGEIAGPEHWQDWIRQARVFGPDVLVCRTRGMLSPQFPCKVLHKRVIVMKLR